MTQSIDVEAVKRSLRIMAMNYENTDHLWDFLDTQAMAKAIAAIDALTQRAEQAERERDECSPYLKDGETPVECIVRNRADADVAIGLLAAERIKVENYAKTMAMIDVSANEAGALTAQIASMQAAIAEAVRLIGFNGCLSQAAEALTYLAQHDRPIGGEQWYNRTHCEQIAYELSKALQGLDALCPFLPAPEPAPSNACQSCGGTGADLYDGTLHDCTVCHGRGTVPAADPLVEADIELLDAQWTLENKISAAEACLRDTTWKPERCHVEGLVIGMKRALDGVTNARAALTTHGYEVRKIEGDA